MTDIERAVARLLSVIVVVTSDNWCVNCIFEDKVLHLISIWKHR